MIIGSHVLKVYFIGYRNLSSKRDTFFNIRRDRSSSVDATNVSHSDTAPERGLCAACRALRCISCPPTWLRPNRASKPSSLCMAD